MLPFSLTFYKTLLPECTREKEREERKVLWGVCFVCLFSLSDQFTTQSWRSVLAVLRKKPTFDGRDRAFELPAPTGKSKGQKIQFHEWNHLESSNQTCFVVPLTLMSTVSSSHPPLCSWGQGRKLNKRSSKPLPVRGLVIQKPGFYCKFV